MRRVVHVFFVLVLSALAGSACASHRYGVPRIPVPPPVISPEPPPPVFEPLPPPRSVVPPEPPRTIVPPEPPAPPAPARVSISRGEDVELPRPGAIPYAQADGIDVILKVKNSAPTDIWVWFVDPNNEVEWKRRRVIGVLKSGQMMDVPLPDEAKKQAVEAQMIETVRQGNGGTVRPKILYPVPQNSPVFHGWVFKE